MKTYLIAVLLFCLCSCLNTNEKSKTNIASNSINLRFVLNKDTLFVADKDLDSLLTVPDAYKLVHGVKINGYSDWRIPTIDELDYLYKNKIGNFDPTWYWSYGKEMFSQALNFKDGSKKSIKFRSKLKVRLIRGGKVDLENGIETKGLFHVSRNFAKIGMDTIKLFKILPKVNVPFNDSIISKFNPGILLNLNTLHHLSIDNQRIYQSIGNEEKIVKAICLVNFSDKFVSLVIKIIPLPERGGGENYLLTYSDIGLVDICPFGGECIGQCDCYQFLYVYRNQIKIISFAPCPSETGNEEQEGGHVEKYRFDGNGNIEEIQRYSISHNDFLRYSQCYKKYHYIKHIGRLKDICDYVFTYISDSDDSVIEGIVLNNERFNFWDDQKKDWVFIETSSGLEGFIKRKDIK